MNAAPRLEIDLNKIHHNASTLVGRLGNLGISVTAITKATLGSIEIGRTLLQAGVRGLGDSRIQNIQAMREVFPSTPMALIRTPMLSQVGRVVQNADSSLNTELAVIRALSIAAKAARLTHGVVLMVELGDLREGIMPADLEGTVRETLGLPHIELLGIGANLACCNGVAPDARNMAELSALAASIEATFGIELGIVSGGNSSSLEWAFSGAATGRINNLRLGESLLLGRETLHRRPIEGLYTDAITLVAEVIESKQKPSQPWGEIAQNAFGETPRATDRGLIWQAILAIGRQDIDPSGLRPSPGIEILASSSDHMMVHSSGRLVTVGAELVFQLDYSALVRSMTSPFVAKVMKTRAIPAANPIPAKELPIALPHTGR